jgi:hypothetical protein
MADCRQAILDSDEVIRKQGEVLVLVANQNEKLKDENQELTAALLKMKNESSGQTQQLVLAGVGGILVGVLVMAWVKK